MSEKEVKLSNTMRDAIDAAIYDFGKPPFNSRNDEDRQAMLEAIVEVVESNAHGYDGWRAKACDEWNRVADKYDIGWGASCAYCVAPLAFVELGETFNPSTHPKES